MLDNSAVVDVNRFTSTSNAFVVYSYSSNYAKDVLDTILSIQPKDTGGGGETRESVVYKMASEMLGKLPTNYKPYEVS